MQKNAKFVVFGTGADFTYRVLESLIQQQVLPIACVLPGFAPVAIASSPLLSLKQPIARQTFLSLLKTAGIPVLYQGDRNNKVLIGRLKSLAPEFLLVACWPALLPPDIIDIPTQLAVNLHPSLLPKYRGADPLHAQLQTEDADFGVTLHQLSDEFDAGEIVSQEKIAIASRDLKTIERQAAEQGVRLFIQAFNDS